MPLRTPCVLACVLFGARVFAQTMEPPPGPVQPAALTALNDAFRAAYTDAKKRLLSAPGPTLIVAGDRLSVLREGKPRLEANVGTALYDPVKTIAHIPLAIYVTLTPGEGALDDSRAKTLTGLRALIPPAQESLDTLKLPGPTLARQKQIVADCVAYIGAVTEKRHFTRESLQRFTRKIAPLVMQNVDDAMRAQLDALHAQMSVWRRELTPEEWSALHVLIIGPHMPRDGLVVTQYFLRLLHEPQEGRRVVYAESQWQEAQALDLLGTHLLDGSVGEAFFGEYMRMHRDLLGDAAKRYLPKLLSR